VTHGRRDYKIKMKEAKELGMMRVETFLFHMLEGLHAMSLLNGGNWKE